MVCWRIRLALVHPHMQVSLNAATTRCGDSGLHHLNSCGRAQSDKSTTINMHTSDFSAEQCHSGRCLPGVWTRKNQLSGTDVRVLPEAVRTATPS